MTDFRLKIRDFYRRNKSKIVAVLVIWFIIFIINLIVKNLKSPQVPSVSYSPHTAIMDNSKVPDKQVKPIEEMIDRYIGYCNEKEYENAYNMLSVECRSAMYPNIEDYKAYINRIFTEKKVYTIQNYSNVDDTYIYKVDIFEDILATGLTGKDGLSMYSEKFVIKNDKGNLSFSISDFLEKRENYQVYEDNYIKVEVIDVTQTYENQVYTVKISNRTEYPIVLADNTEKYEILLELDNDNRNIQDLPDRGIYLNPYEIKQMQFKFVKFFDEKNTARSIIFNAVRVLKSYSGIESRRQSELDNAVRLYSFQIGL